MGEIKPIREIETTIDEIEGSTINIGRVYENKVTKLLVDLSSTLIEHPNATASLVVRQPNWQSYPATVTLNGMTLEWFITDAEIGLQSGTGEIQITVADGEQIYKSAIAQTVILPSILYKSGSIPDPIAHWISQAQAELEKTKEALNTAQNFIADLKQKLDNGELNGKPGPQGEKGEKGDPGKDAPQEAVLYTAQTLDNAQKAQARENIGAVDEGTVNQLKDDLDNKIEHVGGYKEYDIGTPSVGTYWNKSVKKQLESEICQSFNPISLKAGTYHYENMSGSFTFYEDTDGNWIPIGKYSASGNGDVVITNDTTMYITEMQKSGVFVGAKLSSGDITQKESNWFKNPKYDIDNINNTLESLSDSVNDIKSIDGSAIKEYCIYVSTTGSDTSGDGSEEKPFATIYHANETITDNSYTKRYRIIVLPGTYTDLQDKYTGIAHTNKYQGVITKPWVTYESKSGNPKDTIIEWDGSTGLENPTRDDVVDKCAFHIVSLPRTFTAIK